MGCLNSTFWIESVVFIYRNSLFIGLGTQIDTKLFDFWLVESHLASILFSDSATELAPAWKPFKGKFIIMCIAYTL